MCLVLFQRAQEVAVNIAQGAMEGHAHKGIPGAVGGVLQHAPGTVIMPFIITSSSTANVIEGIQNHMAPDKRREQLEKWKPQDDEL